MDLQLTDKLTLVTGSTGGIGFAIAETLAREGAHVIINGRTQAGVDEALSKLAQYKVSGFAGDLGTKDACDEVAQRFPDVEILVNNLGIYEAKNFAEIPDEDWLRFFEVNVMSGVRLSRAYLDGMKTRNWGRIIFISSESAINIQSSMVHYGVTKAAQIVIGRGLAEAVAGTGITVNSILPGPTHSRGTVPLMERLLRNGDKTQAQAEADFISKARPTSLIKRLGRPEEVASMVAYIASPLSSATNGVSLRVEGGIVQSPF